MSKYSKFNMVYRLQKWMDSVSGQTFLNYAYSWGAAVVILGTLFKLTHLPGANFFLFLGMGTEVFVFFLSAFDRPFDKTADGMELQHGNREDGELEKYVSHAKRTMAAVVMAQTQYRLDKAENLCDGLPENEETAELKKTLNAVHEIYKLQLSKAGSQMTTMEEIDRQLHSMSENLKDLNIIYARMIAAVKQ